MIKNNFLQHVSVSSSVGFLESSTSSNSVYCNVKHRHETDNARKFTINNDSGTVQSNICDKCGKCFATKRYLVKHGDSHVDKKLECEICGKVLKQPLTLKKHLLTHQSKKLVCSICGKKYQSYVGWISHMALHKDTKTEFICSICQRDCRSKDYLRLHMKNKHSCDPHSDYNCEECKKSFKSKLSLRNHSALRHGKTEGMKLYKCMICGKKSLNKYCHQKHLLKHNHSIPLTCEICCSTFKHQTSLLSHKKIVHSEGENFPCSTCGKSFKTKSYLNTHMSNVHVISDREKCRFCKKIFKTTVTLRNHIQACHTPERRKQHVCEYCCRSFLAPKDLNRHMTIHTGLKNFKCEICDKAFSRLDNLNVHKKMHYKVKSKPTDVQYEIS